LFVRGITAANSRRSDREPTFAKSAAGVKLGRSAIGFRGPLSSRFPHFLTAVLAADRNINYSRENRSRALMARS
jgi:hypothetical protein